MTERSAPRIADQSSHLVRRKVLRSAVRWLLSAAEGIEPARSLSDAQRLGELALAADILDRRHRSAGPRLVPRTFPRQLLTACWLALGRGETLRKYVERDRAGGLFVTACPPFVRNGFRNPDLEAALRRVLATTDYRPLDYAILIEGAQRLFSTVLGRPRHVRRRWPARWTRPRPALSDVYLLAHAVFYETDFGRRPHGLLPANRRTLFHRLPDLFEQYVLIGHCDIVAELVLVACFLRHPVPQAAWDLLEEEQRPDGSIAFARRRRRSASDAHTTLVVIMAAVSCDTGARGDRDGTSRRTRQIRHPRVLAR